MEFKIATVGPYLEYSVDCKIIFFKCSEFSAFRCGAKATIHFCVLMDKGGYYSQKKGRESHSLQAINYDNTLHHYIRQNVGNFERNGAVVLFLIT